MDTVKKSIPFFLVLLLDFYLLPLAMRDTGSAMLVMLIVIPLVCLGCSIVFGARLSFRWWYTVLTAILFTPTLWIYYNDSAWVYIPAYAVIALIGNLIGMAFYKPKKQQG